MTAPRHGRRKALTRCRDLRRGGDCRRRNEAPASEGSRKHLNADGVTPKRGFATRSAAKDEARLKRQRDGIVMSVYGCPVCGAWHIGTR